MEVVQGACQLTHRPDRLKARSQADLSGIAITNLLVPTRLGSTANGPHAVTRFYLLGAWVSAKQLQARAQEVTYSP